MPEDWKINSFKEFVGQSKLKQILKIMIQSAKKKQKSLDHILIYGKSGQGKTTIASLIANELKEHFQVIQGNSLETKSDLLTLFAQFNEKKVIFIDEIHALNKNIEELLYSAIDKCSVDILVGPEGDQKVLSMKLPSFTIVGATTKIGDISITLRNRFGLVYKMEEYSSEDMLQITSLYFEKANLVASEEAKKLVISCSMSTPRICLHLIKRIIDICIVDNHSSVDQRLVKKTFKLIGMYKNGLNQNHIDYLSILASNENKGWSLSTLAFCLHLKRMAVEEIIEKDLIFLKYIKITSRGRTLTDSGINYLKNYEY